MATSIQYDFIIIFWYDIGCTDFVWAAGPKRSFRLCRELNCTIVMLMSFCPRDWSEMWLSHASCQLIDRLMMWGTLRRPGNRGPCLTPSLSAATFHVATQETVPLRLDGGDNTEYPTLVNSHKLQEACRHCYPIALWGEHHRQMKSNNAGRNQGLPAGKETAAPRLCSFWEQSREAVHPKLLFFHYLFL